MVDLRPLHGGRRAFDGRLHGRWTRPLATGEGSGADRREAEGSGVMNAREAAWLGGVGAGLAGVAFVVSVILGGLARRWAPRVGLIDRPGGHKGHQSPTPLGG